MPYQYKLAAMNLYEHKLIPFDNILDCVGFATQNKHWMQVVVTFKATNFKKYAKSAIFETKQFLFTANNYAK